MEEAVDVEYVAQRVTVCESEVATSCFLDMKARFAEKAGYMMRALGKYRSCLDVPVLIIKDSRNARAGRPRKSPLLLRSVPWQCLTLILFPWVKCINSSANGEPQGFRSFILPKNPITALVVSEKND